MCKVPFSAKDVKPNDSMLKEMKEKSTTCKCGQSLLVTTLAAHKLQCAFYNQEISELAKKLIKKPPAGYHPVLRVIGT